MTQIGKKLKKLKKSKLRHMIGVICIQIPSIRAIFHYVGDRSVVLRFFVIIIGLERAKISKKNWKKGQNSLRKHTNIKINCSWS
jgi:hypothetical protein